MKGIRDQFSPLLLSCLFLVAPGPALHGQQIPAEVRESIRARVDNGYNVGIVLGVIEPGGTRFFSYGKRSVAGEPVPDSSTVFEIGSISKAFTALLLADMVQRGEVRLDDPIEKYLPESVTVARRAGRSITLGDLATQTSGLPRLPGNLAPTDPNNPYADYSVEQLYAFLSGHTLRRDVGSQYEYSNLGFGLLGHILELRSGMAYDELVQQRIAGPLGLEDTRVQLTPEMRGRLAAGHGDGAVVANWDIPTLAGAGALRSDATDLLRFVGANLGLVESPLEAAMRMTHEPRAETGSPNLRIGLGWHILESGGKQIVWHNGGTGGYRSFAGFALGDRRGVVVLTNSNSGVDDLGIHVLDPTAPLDPVRTRITLDPETLDRYVGEYELQPGVTIEITRRGTELMAQLTGQPKFRILAKSPTEFFLTVVDAQIRFVRDEAGNVSALVLRQGGRDQTARRRTP